jgi:hypothetical protein
MRVQSCDFARGRNLHPELHRLRDGVLGKLRAAQPGWKAQVILDPRTGCRLAARAYGVEQNRC